MTSSALIDALNHHGIEPPQKTITSDSFARWGKDNRYFAKEFEDGSGWIYGDWSQDLSELCFRESTRLLSSEDIAKRQKTIELEKTKAREERKQQQKLASSRAHNLWNNATPAIYNHPYLERKKIISHGLKQNGDTILIPLLDTNKQLCSIQFIDAHGKKRFLPSGKTKSCYFPIGKPKNKIYICEGYATGATIHEATDNAVAVAFYAKNLKPVTRSIRAKFPEIEIIVAADNDQFKTVNTGIENAKDAAHSVNCAYIAPEFKDCSTNPTDFNDLYLLEGLETVKTRICEKQTTDDNKWQPPILFDEYETPPITADVLPLTLRSFARSLANTTETPEAMAVMCVLSTLATALQGKFEVKPKNNDNYSEPLNIYVITALPPANRKSAVLKYCTNPLIEWEKSQKIIIEPEIKRQRSVLESKRELIKGLRRKLSNGDNSAIHEIAELEANLPKPDSLPRLFVNDATPETLITLVDEQKGKISIISDEGGIIDVVAGLYTGGNSNIDILLKGWDGSLCRTTRKDKDISVHPLLTVNLVVQPQVIHNLATKKSFRGKGLLERFLYCLPKSLLGYRTNDKPPIPPKVIGAYNELITSLLNIATPENPWALYLDEAAHAEWRDFQNTIEQDLRACGRLSVCQGWGGKICGQALRIAGLLHVAVHKQASDIINATTMQQALELCSLLVFHAIATFNLMENDPDIRDAKKAWEWIMSIEEKQFKKSDVTVKMKNWIKADRLNKILNILIQRNLISTPIKEGKKTEVYNINPACLCEELS